MDRVRGGRQKYRRNPTVNPYQLMLPQSTSHIAPATLEEIKMLEILLNGEPELLTIGGGVVGCCTSSTATQSETTVVAPSSQSTAPSNEDDKMLVDEKSSMGIGQDGGGDVAKRIVSSQADAQEMLSVLSDIYDKELVSVIGWAKQIPGTFFWWIRLFNWINIFFFFYLIRIYRVTVERSNEIVASYMGGNINVAISVSFDTVYGSFNVCPRLLVGRANGKRVRRQ